MTFDLFPMMYYEVIVFITNDIKVTNFTKLSSL